MVAKIRFLDYCKTMFENIKIYTSDEYWKHILTDLCAVVVDDPNTADIMFDNIGVRVPISVPDLQKTIFDCVNSTDIIHKVFGKNVYLPVLQHKIVVQLYKKTNMSMSELKSALGVLPDVTTHVVENAIYQLRKIYGHDFIVNENGKYKIGHI